MNMIFISNVSKIVFYKHHSFFRHYILANSNLLEVRMTDSNLQEIKTVASFITYKLCKVYFTLNQPRDAISQFNTHVDRFRAKSGPHELIFEHYAWLSKQQVPLRSLVTNTR